MSTSQYSSRPLHHGNMTRAMAKSMKGMGDALSCFLCSKVIDQPRTLSACGHSFCFACIEDYAKDNWHCPVPGCGQAMTLVGNRKGKFHCTNPSLETLATSFQAIQQTLRQAPPEWWKDKEEETTEHNATTSNDNDNETRGNAQSAAHETTTLRTSSNEQSNVTVRTTDRHPRESAGEEDWTMTGRSFQHDDDDESTNADDHSRILLEDD